MLLEEKYNNKKSKEQIQALEQEKYELEEEKTRLIM